MDIPPVQPPRQPQAISSNDAHEQPAMGEMPFVLGQRLFARVAQVVSEQAAILELGGHRLMTSTPMAVSPGQVLHVDVLGLGSVIELGLVEEPVEMSEAAYELAAVIQARQSTTGGGRVAPEDVRMLLDALDRLPVGKGQQIERANQRQRVTDALVPLRLDGDAGRLVDALRRAIAGWGIFLEAKLAALVQHDTTKRDLSALQGDLKTILAELRPLTQASGPLEETRVRLVANVLERQVDVAYHKVKDHELRLDLPVAIDGAMSEVHLRVRDDGDGANSQSRSAGREIDLTMELPELGRVRTSVSWTPGHLATRFAVERPEQARALEGGLDALSRRLRAVGFREVTLAVRVDPASLAGRPEAPDPPMPGGSILNLRA